MWAEDLCLRRVRKKGQAPKNWCRRKTSQWICKRFVSVTISCEHSARPQVNTVQVLAPEFTVILDIQMLR